MSDELRKGVLSAQRADRKAVLPSQLSLTESVTFEDPIIIDEMSWLKDQVPNSYATVADLLNKNECWVTISIDKDVYKELLNNGERVHWRGKSIPLDESNTFLKFFEKTYKRIQKLETQIEKSQSPIISDSKKKITELNELKSVINTLFNGLRLNLSTQFGKFIVKINNENPNVFFCIAFYEKDDTSQEKKAEWPFIEATWSRSATKEFTTPLEVFIAILKAHDTKREADDRWNSRRTRNQILFQIREHLNEERAYLENPVKLDRVRARYRRLYIPNEEENGTGELLLDSTRLELLDEDINEHFQREGSTFTIKDSGSDKWYRIENINETNDTIDLSEKTLLPDTIPEEGILIKAPDTYQNMVKQRTLSHLISKDRPPKLKPLEELITKPQRLKSFPENPVDYIDENLQISTEENESQRLAVAMAMSTPDAALIKGPPGTGKTTVICEIALQHIRMGHKVLIVAPTHIAVDNVLEKIGEVRGVYPLRWGKVDKVDVLLKGYNLAVQQRTLSKKILKEYGEKAGVMNDDDEMAQLQLAWIQDLSQPKRIGDDEDVLESLLKSQANLVCATTIGIVGGALIKSGTIPFDIMIIDEASKSTISEFLVPASYARKWIIVGDEKQLSPYVDNSKINEMIANFLYKQARREEWASTILLPVLDSLNGDHANVAEFYYIEHAIQELIRECASQIRWRLNDHFQQRYSDGKQRKRRKREIFVAITNLRTNLGYEQELHEYERRHLDWQDLMQSLKAQYRSEMNRHNSLCQKEDARYSKERQEYAARQKEITEYPELLQAAKEAHAISVAKSFDEYNMNKNALLETYRQEVMEHEISLNSLDNDTPDDSLAVPILPVIDEYVEDPFSPPQKPTPLPEPKPIVYPKKPTEPNFPDEPRKPATPHYLPFQTQDEDKIIQDDGEHMWKALETTSEFEFESGFESLLHALGGGSKHGEYGVIEDNPRIAQLLYQFRMHPKIAEFNSKVVYDGKYHSASSMHDRGITIPFHTRSLQEPILFLNTSRIRPECEERLWLKRSGEPRDGKIYNEAEVHVIIEVLQELEQAILNDNIRFPAGKHVLSIGVITFYAAQSVEIRKEMGKHFKSPDKWTFEIADGKGIIQVSIVDRFQGREKDIILLSFTRSNKKQIPGFIKVMNRLNVATTRAREKLLLIGNVDFLKCVKDGGIIPKLVKYVREEGVIIDVPRSEIFGSGVKR